MRVCRESLIVGALCLADLVSTIILIRHYGAIEANVVMRFYLQRGLVVFTGAKLFFFVPTLLIAEWCRRRNPRLITGALRLVIVLYVGLYSIGVFTLNQMAATGRRDHSGTASRIGIEASLERSPSFPSAPSAE
jgi:hypothetical protein